MKTHENVQGKCRLKQVVYYSQQLFTRKTEIGMSSTINNNEQFESTHFINQKHVNDNPPDNNPLDNINVNPNLLVRRLPPPPRFILVAWSELFKN